MIPWARRMHRDLEELHIVAVGGPLIYGIQEALNQA